METTYDLLLLPPDSASRVRSPSPTAAGRRVLSRIPDRRTRIVDTDEFVRRTFSCFQVYEYNSKHIARERFLIRGVKIV